MQFDTKENRENRYLRAKEQVKEIKKFYTSLFFYIVFIGFLGWLNYYTNEWRYAWFLWAAFGWGIGLVFQAAKAFNWTPFLNKNWEERKIKELMDKEDQFTNDRWQ
ncbi:MAG TPA: histidine kinase [Flavobacteriaceae bacterium]|nr:histidine kinase [Flavobacteriaceae bacterium]HAT66806.1 histidine kinase [Flavobacteriaceae bacterium]|tara:strand:+ start:93 stop:410 length:318 start_codon:yes stop_codon:yes gene_type:complete